MAGRPTIYTADLTAEISRRLAEGESLRSICRDAHMPAISTVLLWVVDGKHQDFSEQYVIARQAQGYSHADKLLDVATMVATGELEPGQAKVIMDAYKWTAERNAPKAYGPKQQIDNISSDKSMTPQLDTSTLSTSTLQELIAAREKTGADK